VAPTGHPEDEDSGEFGTAHVVVVYGPAAGATHPIGRRGLIIGRAGDSGTAELTLPDGRVSRLHARILRRGPRAPWVLRDLGSRNGGAVDGTAFPAEGEVPLADGSVVRLGDTLMIFRPEAPTHAPGVPLRDRREAILDLTGGPARWTCDAAECLLVYPWGSEQELRGIVDTLSANSLGALSSKTLPEHVRARRGR
jgi:hypothetical protein